MFQNFAKYDFDSPQVKCIKHIVYKYTLYTLQSTKRLNPNKYELLEANFFLGEGSQFESIWVKVSWYCLILLDIFNSFLICFSAILELEKIYVFSTPRIQYIFYKVTKRDKIFNISVFMSTVFTDAKTRSYFVYFDMVIHKLATMF